MMQCQIERAHPRWMRPLRVFYILFFCKELQVREKVLSRIFIGLTKDFHRCDKKFSQARQNFIKPMITIFRR